LKTCLRQEATYKKIQYKEYFYHWINLKNVFKDFSNYKGRFDMVEMLKECNIKLEGKHHSGIDDVKNITKIVIHLLKNGAKFHKGNISKY